MTAGDDFAYIFEADPVPRLRGSVHKTFSTAWQNFLIFTLGLSRLEALKESVGRFAHGHE